MNRHLDRREFLKTTGTIAAATTLTTLGAGGVFAAEKTPLFDISLAQWSFHRSLRGGGKKMNNLDFAKESKKLGIHAIEYVNQFFKNEVKDEKYLTEMKKRLEEPQAMLLVVPNGKVKLLNALPFAPADIREHSISEAWKLYQEAWKSDEVRGFVEACSTRPELLLHANETWPMGKWSAMAV